MTDYNSSLVNLSIPKDVTTPIVAAKIQEAVLAALGGADKIVSGVINQICNTKVSDSGSVSSYSSDNKHTWLDFHVTKIIQEEVKKELISQLTTSAAEIRQELIRQLKTKKGASLVADALLSSLNGTFTSSYRSNIKVEFISSKD